MKRSLLVITTLLLVGLAINACQTAPKTRGEQLVLEDNADSTIKRFQRKDPGLDEFFTGAAGYAVFPKVGKGAIGIGGAYGKGILYQNGGKVGYCDLSQGSIGFQLGGQAYSEIIFLQTSSNLEDFKSGQFAFAAQASAVAVTSGASADAAYENGAAVFTMSTGGLMFEASIGGQNFSYRPMD